MLFITEYCSVKNTYSKVSKFPFHIHQCLKENFGNLSVNLEIHSIWLRHRSWDSMTHDTCTLILQCQCLVSCNCRKYPAKKAIQGHSGQMSSKSILIGSSIFQCGNEISVHGRPSWELDPYDCTFQITEDFPSWCKLVSKECRFSERAGECGVVLFSTQYFWKLTRVSDPLD